MNKSYHLFHWTAVLAAQNLKAKKGKAPAIFGPLLPLGLGWRLEW